MSSADRRLRTAGFTLMELLIAVVLSGILASVIFQMVRGQSRFTQMQSAREEVDQNTRGALELITSELRAVPAGAVVNAGATQITVRTPRVWGLLCAPASSNRAVVIFPADSAAPLNLPTDFAGNQSWGIAIQRDGSPQVYQAFTITSATDDPAACSTSMGDPFSEVPATALPVAKSFGYSTAAPVSATAGRAFVYQTITYDAAVSTDAAIPGTWLRRTGTKTLQQQPLAGPLDTRDLNVPPLSFRYFCNGVELSPALLATEVGRLAITTVEVQVGMMSRESTKSVQQVERDTLLIHLRNTGSVTCP